MNSRPLYLFKIYFWKLQCFFKFNYVKRKGDHSLYTWIFFYIHFLNDWQHHPYSCSDQNIRIYLDTFFCSNFSGLIHFSTSRHSTVIHLLYFLFHILFIFLYSRAYSAVLYSVYITSGQVSLCQFLLLFNQLSL